ncbi:hypothetical protein [Chitinophaga flava]|uniref:DUF4468 domain-containing protein n=1 Tax=Chitinophaga flava TaxID=2259036 RepID=A0A365XUW8_9BACT|nr:hypothetical protein [Chitinophaga flava]RBL89918.1 hypothetical protein DF182_25925 [Chitinophaga flava]
MKRNRKKVFALLTGCLFATTSTSAQRFSNTDKYLQGYYIDTTGCRIEGFIAMDEISLESFNFKKQLGGKKEPVSVSQCRSFSFEQHVFCTITDITIRTRLWSYHFNRVFAEQMADGPIQLFRLYFKPGKVGYMRYVSLASRFASGDAAQGAGMFLNQKYVNYFLKKTNDTSGYCFVGKKPKQFKKVLSAYLKDDDQLVHKINTIRDYSFNNIESVIREYNQDIRNK